MSRHHRRKPRHDVRQSPAHRTPLGAPPGTLRVDPDAPPSIITVIAFGPQGLVERELKPHELRQQLPPILQQYPVTWVNLDGLGDVEALRQLAELFHLHPLAMEDVVNVHQRPKLELFPDHFFFVLHEVSFTTQVEVEQVSLFLGQKFVLTFQEDVGDCLEPVRDRIRHQVGLMRTQGADYLMYSIIDAMIDHYFPLLEYLGEHLEQIEDDIVRFPNHDSMAEIHGMKRQLIQLRRKIWPLRDALNTLVRDPLPQISDSTRVYLRDCYDHVMRVIDLLEMYRELGSDLLELQLSSVSFQINRVMQGLTVVATIFIPLTFISSIYGMNFDPDSSPFNMPELRWYFGYPMVLTAMGLLAATILAVSYRRGWLGGRRTARRPPIELRQIPQYHPEIHGKDVLVSRNKPAPSGPLESSRASPSPRND